MRDVLLKRVRPLVYEPSETLHEAIARAEANKRTGELPVPSSSSEF